MVVVVVVVVEAAAAAAVDGCGCRWKRANTPAECCISEKVSGKIKYAASDR